MIADKLNSKIKNRVKNKSKYFILILFLLFTYIGNAQITISGKVITAENKPLELAEVILLTKDSVAIKSELTDSAGHFNLKTNPGNYKIQIRQIGKSLFFKELDTDKDINLGDIMVTIKENLLQEIIISSQKKLIERKVDRLVFNVENSISAAGGDALDALKITPSIRVQNEKISLIGKSSLAVMIDDKLIQLSGDDLINFLKTISSDNIKNIEVITMPPAKYSAEGNSGLINIKLKKVKKDSWSSSIRSAYRQAAFNSENGGINFTFQKNKWSLLTDISGQLNKRIYVNDFNYHYPDQYWQNNITSIKKANTKVFLLNANYEISKKSYIGFQMNTNKSKGNENDENTNLIYEELILLAENYTNGNNKINNSNQSYNLNFSHKLDSLGKFFTMDIDFFEYNNDKNNLFNSQEFNHLTNNVTIVNSDNLSDQNIKNYSFKTDWEIPFDLAELSFGSKISSTISSSSILSSVISNANNIIPNQKDEYEFIEKTHAVYFSGSKKFNTRWETKLGLRTEFTKTISNSISTNQETKYNYAKLFPSFYLIYKPNDNSSYSINFNRRINRPSFWELNPARWYINTKSYNSGNPFLQPSFAYNYEFTYSYKSLLQTRMYFTHTKNGFGQIIFHDYLNNSQRFFRLNYYNENTMGINSSINKSFYSIWDVTMENALFYSETKTDITSLNPKYSGWGGYTSVNNNIRLSKTLSANFYYEYNYPMRQNAFRETGYNYLNISIKKYLYNKALLVNFSVSDVFKSGFNTLSSRSDGVIQNFTQYYDTCSARLTLTYTFGNDKLKINEHTAGNQSERNRSGS